eukprot:CAMPEP_0115014998 /NCGR_PEP_ID=MMETSP0216-20121206/26462_1 /TAXON_ID=223996 /ORGANISM="Protocruzia adherens, Strain Boccale" /LENGTH=692 /DNA_ID=CAMNT_0002384945 /DNA_START=41 /DNA_END=2119 /DNA_ORIENTATION=+
MMNNPHKLSSPTNFNRSATTAGAGHDIVLPSTDSPTKRNSQFQQHYPSNHPSGIALSHHGSSVEHGHKLHGSSSHKLYSLKKSQTAVKPGKSNRNGKSIGMGVPSSTASMLRSMTKIPHGKVSRRLPSDSPKGGSSNPTLSGHHTPFGRLSGANTPGNETKPISFSTNSTPKRSNSSNFKYQHFQEQDNSKQVPTSLKLLKGVVKKHHKGSPDMLQTKVKRSHTSTTGMQQDAFGSYTGLRESHGSGMLESSELDIHDEEVLSTKRMNHIQSVYNHEVKGLNVELKQRGEHWNSSASCASVIFKREYSFYRDIFDRFIRLTSTEEAIFLGKIHHFFSCYLSRLDFELDTAQGRAKENNDLRKHLENCRRQLDDEQQEKRNYEELVASVEKEKIQLNEQYSTMKASLKSMATELEAFKQERKRGEKKGILTPRSQEEVVKEMTYLKNENQAMSRLMKNLQNNFESLKVRESKAINLLTILKEKGYPVEDVYREEMRNCPSGRVSGQTPGGHSDHPSRHNATCGLCQSCSAKGDTTCGHETTFDFDASYEPLQDGPTFERRRPSRVPALNLGVVHGGVLPQGCLAMDPGTLESDNIGKRKSIIADSSSGEQKILDQIATIQGTLDGDYENHGSTSNIKIRDFDLYVSPRDLLDQYNENIGHNVNDKKIGGFEDFANADISLQSYQSGIGDGINT